MRAPRTTRSLRGARAAARGALLVGTALAAIIAPHSVTAQEIGLDILLTNADGFDAPGIAAMREALVAAGHRVTIVAPLGDRRASGMSTTTSGTIDYYRQEEGVWAIDGTPSDAVTLGLVHVLRATPPDLVVSGLSFGQSVGADILASGTVGAAQTASRAGVPAIAVSVATDLAERDVERPFVSTHEAFEGAAALVVDIVRQLAETSGSGLLRPRTVLNVNYPAVGGDGPAGVRFASVSGLRAFRQVYAVAGETGPATVELAVADPSRAEEGSDLALLSAGYATISVLDDDWDAGRESWEPLLERLIIER